MGGWDSKSYLKFSAQRTQPAIDLINRIDLYSPSKIIDIGCGPGNSTGELCKHFGGARIVGIDNSKNMIDAAKDNYPSLEFALCDAGSELNKMGAGYDLVFSNACIQWIQNHNKLLRNMITLLKPGGVLAVQTPMNYQEPIHKIIGEVSSSEKWENKFPFKRIFFNLTQGEYYDILSEISTDFNMWETTYFHNMKSHADIIAWYSSTGLRPYLDALSEEDRLQFEKEIFDRVVNEYPRQKNGDIIFRFPRLFFTAVK